jgi:hypothetical protein
MSPINWAAYGYGSRCENEVANTFNARERSNDDVVSDDEDLVPAMLQDRPGCRTRSGGRPPKRQPEWLAALRRGTTTESNSKTVVTSTTSTAQLVLSASWFAASDALIRAKSDVQRRHSKNSTNKNKKPLHLPPAFAVAETMQNYPAKVPPAIEEAGRVIVPAYYDVEIDENDGESDNEVSALV